MTARVLLGDALERLRELPGGSVHCIVTSPPYYGLRRYAAGPQEMGSEATPEAYLAAMVAVFREARRVLRDDGTCWVDIGDSMGGSWGNYAPGGIQGKQRPQSEKGRRWHRSAYADTSLKPGTASQPPLNTLGIPERLVLALQADGWVWRSTVVWAKPAPMPESLRGWAWEQHRVKVKAAPKDSPKYDNRARETVGYMSTNGSQEGATWADCPGCPACAPNDGLVLRRGSWRCTRAWEPIFMLTKGGGYYSDGEAVKQEATSGGSDSKSNYAVGNGRAAPFPRNATDGTRNPRNVWVIPPEPCNWDFCLACGTWYGKGGWARRSIRRWSTRELDVETEEYKSVQHRRCANCKAVDEFVDHYAAFPTELPRRCIAASTSERGVCPECGAPWARVIERRPARPDNIYTGSAKPESINPIGNHQVGMGQKYQNWLDENPTQTLRWRATCSCAAGEPVAATVLDLFMGTATTLLAAARLGRDAIGIDLSERYCALATARLAADVPLLGMAPAGPTAALGGEDRTKAV